jgi:hypothetical protein
VTSAPAESVSGAIEKQTRNDEQVDLFGGDYGVTGIRLWNTAVTGTKDLIGRDFAKDDRAALDAGISDTYSSTGKR